MKIDFEQKLQSIKGKPLKLNADEDLTLKAACVEGLLMQPQNDRGAVSMTAETKLKRNALAEKIYGAGPDTKLTAAEITMALEAVDAWANMFPHLAVRVYTEAKRLLDPEPDEATDKDK